MNQPASPVVGSRGRITMNAYGGAEDWHFEGAGRVLNPQVTAMEYRLAISHDIKIEGFDDFQVKTNDFLVTFKDCKAFFQSNRCASRRQASVSMPK